MHVIAEETIEVAHLGIPETLGDVPDLLLWEQSQHTSPVTDGVRWRVLHISANSG
jgi:hypothetical protein